MIEISLGSRIIEAFVVARQYSFMKMIANLHAFTQQSNCFSVSKNLLDSFLKIEFAVVYLIKTTKEIRPIQIN